MTPTTLAVVSVLVGVLVGGGLVALVLRRRAGGAGGAGPDTIGASGSAAVGGGAEVAAAQDGSATAARDASGAPIATDAPGVPAAPDAPAATDADAAPEAPPQVPELPLRPHPTDPALIGDRVLVELAGLGALVRDAPPAPLDEGDAMRLGTAVAAVADGGLLVLPGPTRGVLREALRALHATAGDLPVLGVPVPRRESADDAGRAPLRTLVADPAPLARAGRVVLVVEDAELHLRRGLDADALARLTAAAPSAVLILHVGACEHDASAIDDAGRWLDGLILDVGGDRIAAAGRHDPELDLPLMAAVEDAPLLADLAEAAAYARAAGRLPDVPLGVVARVAAIIAGGSGDEPAAGWQLGTALARDTSEPPLIRYSMLDRDGLPTTLRAPAALVARCVADPAVLTPQLLAVLLDEADAVERLLVARRLAGGARPGLALPALDALVEGADGPDATPTDLLLAAEARLVRGVARDRLGLATAADDYHAVATGGHGTLSAHGAFLLGGILETADDLAPARAAYRSCVAAADPVHSAMAAFNLAWLEERAGAVETAMEGYRTVATGEHRDAAPMAALNLATLLERRKRHAEAESWYRAAAEAGHPDASPMAALGLGLMLEGRQRPREARALFRQAASSGHAEAAPLALRRLGAPRR